MLIPLLYLSFRRRWEILICVHSITSLHEAQHFSQSVFYSSTLAILFVWIHRPIIPFSLLNSRQSYLCLVWIPTERNFFVICNCIIIYFDQIPIFADFLLFCFPSLVDSLRISENADNSATFFLFRELLISQITSQVLDLIVISFLNHISIFHLDLSTVSIGQAIILQWIGQVLERAQHWFHLFSWNFLQI